MSISFTSSMSNSVNKCGVDLPSLSRVRLSQTEVSDTGKIECVIKSFIDP